MNPTLSKIGNVNDLFSRVASIANALVYILVGFAVLYIIYSIVMYFIKSGEGDENRHKAGMQIFYGIVGLFVIVSVWGLVNILLNTFGTDNTAPTERFPSADFVGISPAQTTNVPGDYGGELQK
jgi:uncharacterized membrane protein YuzA (DUF378 family)